MAVDAKPPASPPHCPARRRQKFGENCSGLLQNRMWLRRLTHTLRPKVWARLLPRHAPEDDAPFLEPHISIPLSMTLPPSADSFLRASFLHLT
jgi:hypothetical protein